MITNKLSEIMGRNRQKISDVIDGTGLARNTVAELYHGRVKRVDIETLDKLCSHFGVGVGDILEYTDDKKGTEK